mgnify:FL=1
MSSCKIISPDNPNTVPELVRKNLFQWCKDENYESECIEKNLHKMNEINDCIIGSFRDEIKNLSKEEIKNKIMEHRKTYIQLQNLADTIDDSTHKRDLGILNKLHKVKYQELIVLIIIVILYILFIIYLVFNYFKM